MVCYTIGFSLVFGFLVLLSPVLRTVLLVKLIHAPSVIVSPVIMVLMLF